MSKVSIFTAAVGDFPRKWDYLINLYNGFSRFLGYDFTFYCIVDKEVYIDRDVIHYVQQARNVWGWWNLMELYRPDAPWSAGHVIMVGLDTVIRGDVSWLVQDRPTFLRPIRESLGMSGAYNGTYADGAVCLPPGCHYPEVWEEYCRRVPEDVTQKCRRNFPMHPWVTEVIKGQCSPQPQFWQDILPGKLRSFKQPTPAVDEPSEPLIIFHGSPRPHEAIAQAPWIQNYWRK